MKAASQHNVIGAALIALATLHPQLATVFAQGSLTPPGAPAPTMKTLQQVEPRTPISSAPYTISSPGSYYLTTNLVGTSGNNGITISSSHVVLDMEGFALTGVPGSLSGIPIGATCTNVTVRNGSISGWGGAGVNSAGQGVLLEQLHASGNTSYGLATASGSIVDCTTVYNGYIGISALNSTVRGCLSVNNSSYGIWACYSSVYNCEVQYNAASGIFAEYATVSDCHVSYNVMSGIYAELPGCQIIGNASYSDNTSASTSHAGIFVDDASNRIEANHVVGSGHAGIQVAGTYSGNVVIRNTVSSSGSNYITNSQSAFGPIITASGTITNVNPWANFSY